MPRPETKVESPKEELTELLLNGTPFASVRVRDDDIPPTMEEKFDALGSSIEGIGSTEPTYHARPVVWVQDDETEECFIPKGKVFADVARAVSALNEIDAYVVPSDISVRHSVTGKLLTEEWLFEYLAKAINFKHLYREEDDGKVPAWLPRMIIEYGKEFSAKMW